MNQDKTFDLGVLLNGDREDMQDFFNMLGTPQPNAKRELELIRLGCVVPRSGIGYIDQLAGGTRKLRLDAARQLERYGIEWENVDTVPEK